MYQLLLSMLTKRKSESAVPAEAIFLHRAYAIPSSHMRRTYDQKTVWLSQTLFSVKIILSKS